VNLVSRLNVISECCGSLFLFLLILFGVCHRSSLWSISFLGFHLYSILFSSSAALLWHLFCIGYQVYHLVQCRFCLLLRFVGGPGWFWPYGYFVSISLLWSCFVGFCSLQRGGRRPAFLIVVWMMPSLLILKHCTSVPQLSFPLVIWVGTLIGFLFSRFGISILLLWIS